MKNKLSQFGARFLFMIERITPQSFEAQAQLQEISDLIKDANGVSLLPASELDYLITAIDQKRISFGWSSRN